MKFIVLLFNLRAINLKTLSNSYGFIITLFKEKLSYTKSFIHNLDEKIADVTR